MNRSTINSTLLALCCFVLCFNARAQSQAAHNGHKNGMQVKNGMTTGVRNYKTFTPQYKNTSTEAIQSNAGYEQNPEIGMLYAEAPCSDCYELIGKRTETSKTFVKEGTDGHDIMQQTSTAPMHYRDVAGNWRTIKTQLEPDKDNAGVYAAHEQEVPVNINTTGKYTALGKAGKRLQFNNNLELVYAKPDGTETAIGNANWSNYTAGDDGVYVTNAWPGVDIEMYAVRGAVKTNFIINRPMPAYADGKLLVRDHLQMDNGLSLYAAVPNKYSGNLEIRGNDGEKLYVLSAPTVCEKKNIKGTFEMLDYYINGNTVDIALPGNFLNRPEASYPVIIDPLVSTATVSAVSGSTYSADWTVPCVYANAATVPANVTVTDVQWSFNYITSGGAWLEEGAVDFRIGTCRSPTGTTGLAGFYWYCDLIGAGTCTGTAISIFSDISSCIPAPQCASYPLNVTMDFYQDYLPTTPCATTYVTSATPLTITVFGHTVEASTVTSTGGTTTICAGQSVTLSTTASNGVAPYTYVWNPGGITGNPATLSPTATTTYTVTVTDACGITATSTKTITVNPLTPITGTESLCVGTTTTLADATTGGTWSSSTAAIATIGASSGVATGVSAGTSNITYTTASGCKATAIVTVTPLPGAITGTTTLCAGSTAALADAVGGGTWSSSSAAVATVSTSGVVTGVSGGTATITYSFGAGCSVTTTVTINPTPDITGTTSTNPTVCGGSDGTITLSGLTAGESYTVHYTGASAVTVTIVADASGQVVITGLSAGTYSSISVTTALGCVSNIAGPVTLIDAGTPPAPVATNSSPVCEGGSFSLAATDATAGVTFSWTGPAGFTSTSATPTVSPAGLGNAGTYSVTATIGGCTSAVGTTVVVINPTPNIAGIAFTNPSTCFGTDGTITLSGLSPALTYDLSYTFNGSPAGTLSITANAGGQLIITGLSSGIYDAFTATSLTCISAPAGPVTLADPGAPPPPVIESNTPLCVGQTLDLTATDAMAGGTYLWSYPDGGTSTDQNPVRTNVPASAAGIYTVTYTVDNCPNTSIANIALYPQITLTDVTTDQTISYGTSIQLNAMGALYYRWVPGDGTLNNPNINNPIATPLEPTVYTVYGTSQWGCTDSATVTISLDYNIGNFIPTAFTPNNDGLNDVFRIKNIKYMKLLDFSVYNRWGQLLYHNITDLSKGWDGTFNGEPQDMGVYNYSIIVLSPDGKTMSYKGDVTLIR